MGSSPSPPPAPDPVATAGAQTSENISTALANASLSHVNQTDGQGNTINYSTNGSTPYTDPLNGHVYQIPQYTETTAMSPANQKIYNTNQATQQNIADIGKTQSANIGHILDTPIDTSSNAINGYLNKNWQTGFNDTWGQKQKALTQSLADQGINLNDPAYATAQRNFDQSQQEAADTYNNDMYGNAQQAMLTARNQPINEVTALMSGSQVQQPNFTSVPQQTIPTTDYAGIVNSGYQNQLAAYNAQQANSAATTGGLFGLGSSLLMGGLMRSDRRLKEGIRKVGRLDNGLIVYAYRLKGSPVEQIGLMADEVQKIHPSAVVEAPDGFLRVDYAKAVR